MYWRALNLAKLTHNHPIGRTILRRQAERAVDSVALNIAEAAGLDGRRNKLQFRIARGSALEVIAAYELADAYGEALPLREVVEEGTAIVAMLTRLARGHLHGHGHVHGSVVSDSEGFARADCLEEFALR